jgi:hypothetical protein
MVIRFEPEQRYILSEFEAQERAVSEAGLIFVIRDEDKNGFRIVEAGETELHISQTVMLPAYWSIERNLILALAWADNGLDVAFTSPLYAYEGGARCNACQRLFLFNLETRWLTQVDHEIRAVRELSWSPHADYLAATVCDKAQALECQIRLYDRQGLQYEPDTGLPENREPQWEVIR